MITLSDKVKVDTSKCIGCGVCVAVCPYGVFEIKDGKSVVVHPEKCTLCGKCVEACPMKAISLKK